MQRLKAGALQLDLLVMAQLYHWVTLGKSPGFSVPQFPDL